MFVFHSPLFAAVLLSLWPIHFIEVDPVFQQGDVLMTLSLIRTFSVMCDHTPFYACKSPDQTSPHT